MKACKGLQSPAAPLSPLMLLLLLLLLLLTLLLVQLLLLVLPLGRRGGCMQPVQERGQAHGVLVGMPRTLWRQGEAKRGLRPRVTCHWNAYIYSYKYPLAPSVPCLVYTCTHP